MTYSKAFQNILTKKLKVKRYTKIYHNYGDVYKDRHNKFLLFKLAMGAPLTAATVHELTFFGIKKFLIVGTAGALSKKLRMEDLIICSKAVRDEGTSHHYIPNSLYSYPNKGLTQKLANAIRKSGIKFKTGPSWTIDAPYAETRQEIEHYRKKGILTVEMEAAALFAVAKKTKTEAAAIFAISDILAEEWTGIKYGKGCVFTLAKVIRLFSESS